MGDLEDGWDHLRSFAERGAAGLKTGPRGPEPGHGRFLDAGQEAEVRCLVRCRTREVRVPHNRAGLGLKSAVTNKGELRWMVLDGSVKAPDLIRILGRLVRDVGRKVFLILDRLSVHRSAKVRGKASPSIPPSISTRTGMAPETSG